MNQCVIDDGLASDVLITDLVAVCNEVLDCEHGLLHIREDTHVADFAQLLVLEDVEAYLQELFELLACLISDRLEDATKEFAPLVLCVSVLLLINQL